MCMQASHYHSKIKHLKIVAAVFACLDTLVQAHPSQTNPCWLCLDACTLFMSPACLQVEDEQQWAADVANFRYHKCALQAHYN